MIKEKRPTTKDICNAQHHCDHVLIAGVCVQDGENQVECDDKNPCTADWCLYGKCRHFPPDKAPPGSNIPPSCCINTADCEDNAGECSVVACVSGICNYTPKDVCILDLPYLQTFNDYKNGAETKMIRELIFINISGLWVGILLIRERIQPS